MPDDALLHGSLPPLAACFVNSMCSVRPRVDIKRADHVSARPLARLVYTLPAPRLHTPREEAMPVLAKLYSCAVLGLEGSLIEVEVDIAQGLPAFMIVGLPDAAVQESKERVRSAIKNSSATFPMRRITVNLAPADLKKEGPAYDLPIAVGLLLASEQVDADVSRSAFLGELSLDGTVRHTDGILPMVGVAQEQGMATVYVPYDDAAEAALVEGMTVIPLRTLADVAAHLNGERYIAPYVGQGPQVVDDGDYPVDFREIRGQEHVQRALEVAAGGHNILMFGT